MTALASLWGARAPLGSLAGREVLQVVLPRALRQVPRDGARTPLAAGRGDGRGQVLAAQTIGRERRGRARLIEGRSCSPLAA